MLGGHWRRDRRGLLVTTALQAGAVLVLIFPAARPASAQMPTARPGGGSVVAGQASIQQNATATTISQSSQRAAVDWTSYNIGSQHTVIYQQPNASSITLNRVTGPDPSQIAGKIVANGQVAIVNPSGVVFHAGSVVDVQSLMVSSANVSTGNFMAGRMVFDQPGRPDAKISNAGHITVKETGLAALVAPQVANTGVITAKMGHVVLAGAEAHTIDLYGDGLMSVDVTREVRHTPAGQTALVTNSGTILADGGTIVLTAKAADGIVQNLVSAGGTLRANSVGDKTGTIVVAGVGGSVTIEGTVQAAGRAAGTKGGTVQVAASDTVDVASGARISASGRAGGGVIALGTTAARALAQGTPAGAGIPAGSSRIVRVAAGAMVKANATSNGRGGTVALLSSERTSVVGTISARGGRVGGDGGKVEISSGQIVGLTGVVDTAAPAGKAGTTLIDPDMLNIGGDVIDPADPKFVSAAAFNAMTGAIAMSATTTVNLIAGSSTALNPTQASSVSLTSGGAINVNVSLTAGGSIPVTLTGGTTININAPVSSGGSLLITGGSINVNAGGTAQSTSGNVRLTGAASVLGIVSAPASGTVTFDNALTLNGGTVSGGTVQTAAVTQNGGSLSANTLTTTGLYKFNGGALTAGNTIAVSAAGLNSTDSITAGALTITATGGTFATAGTATASSGDIHIVLPGSLVPGDFRQTGGTITAAGALTIAGSMDGLTGAPGSVSQFGGTLSAGTTLEMYGLGTISPTLAGTLQGANVQVLAPNAGLTFQPGALTARAGVPNLRLDGATLGLPGDLLVGTLELHSAGNTMQGGIITANTLTGTAGYSATTTPGALPTYTTLAPSAGSVTLGDSNRIATLASYTLAKGTATTRGEFTLNNASALTVTGTVTAADVGINSGGAAMVVNGPIGACAIDAVTSGVVSLTTTGALTLAGGTVGGERVTNLSGGTVAVSGTFVEAGRSGSAPLSGTIGITGPLALSGSGVVTANTVTAGAVTQNGGTMLANNLTTTSYAFSDGTLETNQAVALTLAGLPASALVSANGIMVTATGPFTSAGSLYSSGNLSIVLPSGLTQTGGVLAASGTVTIAGNSAGTLGASGLIKQAAGTIAGGTGVLLYGLGTGPAGLAGALVGPSVQVLEPNAPVSFAPATLAGTPKLTGLGYTSALLHCPGCDGLTPLLPGGPSLKPISGFPATVRVDGATVSLGSAFQAGTLELHSGGDTTQSAAFATGLLLGTAGYGPVIGSGGPTYPSVGSGVGSATLTASNAINTLGPYFATGNLAFVSGTPLGVAGQLVAGANQPSTPSTIALTTPALTVGNQIHFGRVSNGAFATNVRPVAADSGTFTALPPTAVTGAALRTDAIEIDALVTGGEVAIAPLTSGRAMSVDGPRATGDLSLTQGDLNNISAGLLQLGSLDGVTTLAGAIAFNAAATLTTTASTLGLYAAGDVTESPGGGITIGQPTTGGVITGTVGGNVQLGTPAAAVPMNSFNVLGRFAAGGGLSVSDIATASAGRAGLLVSGPVSTGTGDLSLLDAGAVLSGTRYGGALALNGVLNANGHTLSLNARDGVGSSPAITTGSGGSLKAGALVGSAATSDSASQYTVVLNGAANQVTTLGSFAVGPSAGGAPQGAFTLTDTANLEVSGPVLASMVGVSAPNVTVTAAVTAPRASDGSGGTIALTATDGAGTVSMQSGTAGGAVGLSVSAPSGLRVTGGTMDAPSVTLTGNTPLALSGGTVFGDVVSVGGSAAQSGGVLHAKTSLTTTGGLSFSAGDLYAGNGLSFAVPGATLGGQAVTPMNMTVSGSGITSTGTLLAGGTLAITDGGTFTQAAGAIAGSGAVTVSAGDVVNQTGGAMLSGGTVLLKGAGSDGASIKGQIGGGAVQVLEASAGLVLGPSALSGVASGSAGMLVNSYVPNAQTTVLSGAGTAAGQNRPATLQVNGGTVTLGSGTVAIAADAIDLRSAGLVTETNGSIGANVLSVAASQFSATLAGNAVSVLSSAVAPGGIAFTDGISLTTSGPVRASGAGIALNVGGDLVTKDAVAAGTSIMLGASGAVSVAAASVVSGGSIATQSGGATSIAGTVAAQNGLSVVATGVTLAPASSVRAGSATIDAGGGTLVQNGVLAVSGGLAETAASVTQTGQVSAGAALSETASNAASIGGTTVAASYRLSAGGAATLSGVETAPLMIVTAPSITLGNGTIVPGGAAQSGTVSLASLPTVQSAGAGLFLESGGTVMQTGQTSVLPIGGSSQATVRVDLTARAGSIVFGSLSAQQGNLILDLGIGTASGHITVRNLTVFRSGVGDNSTGLANLLGTVAGLPGTAAAGVSAINHPGRDYRINSCAISSVNCIILQPQLVPIGDPLKELVLNFFREQEEDDSLLLPNITDQGL